MRCPLCECFACIRAGAGKQRYFILCESCDLVFVPKAFHCSFEQERRRYDLHNNTKSNEGYVRFLEQVADVVEEACPPPGRLLDYGCGKEAVLTTLLQRRGRECDPFDPLYGLNILPTSRKYDSIILCEVIEHCRNVRGTLLEVGRLLEKGGVVAVRTQLRPSGVQMGQWWYAQDITHINFFSHRSLEIAAGILMRRLETTSVDDIFLMR